MPTFNGDGATPQSGGFLVDKPSLGPFGYTSQQDTPFSQTSIPKALLQDQQAKTRADALRNDPSVTQYGVSSSLGYGGFFIRGFDASDAQSNRIDGLPFTSQASELLYGYERIDILKGANGLLYGFSNPGGIVNYVSKKPLSAPLTQVSVDYFSPTWFGGQADISRRFGENDQFGVRANFAAHQGDLGISGPKNTDVFGALAFDWRFTPSSRAWVNYNYSRNAYDGLQPTFSVPAAVTAVPQAPNTSKFYGEYFSHHYGSAQTIEGGVEGAITPWLDGHATVGEVSAYRNVRYLGATFTNSAGSYTETSSPHVLWHLTDYSQEVMFSPHFETGSFKNKTDIGATLNRETYDNYTQQPNTPIPGMTFNLNSPYTFVNDPVGAYSPSILSASAADFHNYVVRDTLDITRYLTLVGGVSYATYKQIGTANVFGLFATHASPSGAIIIKPIEQVSVYGSYIQGLQAGTQAGTSFGGGTVTNANQFLAPFVSEQYEAGVKYDLNNALQLNGAWFQVTKQNAIYVPNNAVGTSYTYEANGLQRNRGVEFTAIGKVYEGTRIFGGFTYLDPRIEQSQGGTLNGFNAIGVPHWRANLFAEYDIPFVPGLTLLGGVYYTGLKYINSGNTLNIPAYATGDLGVKYATDVAGYKTTFRFYVQNVTQTNYWTSFAGGALSTGDPRTFKLNMTMNF